MNLFKSAAILGVTCGLCIHTASAATFANISRSSPTHMVASTGNLYWTFNNINEFGLDTVAIYRASKDGKPGEERTLYSAYVDYETLGNLTYANVNGSWYGYFISTTRAANGVGRRSAIKKIPLAGGQPTLVHQLETIVDNRPLRTDGEFLYWIDSSGVRRMPINGTSSPTTLVSTSTAGLMELHGTQVYYTDGTVIRRVSKIGGLSSVVQTAAEEFTALHVYSYGSATRILYGLKGGVASKDLGAATIKTYLQYDSTKEIRSVGFDGLRLLWIECLRGARECKVGIHNPTLAPSIATNYNIGVNVNRVGWNNLQWDETEVIWSGVGGVHKYAH